MSKTQHLAARNLMEPNEIMKLAPDTLLLMRVGENTLIVRKLRYYADKELAGLFDPTQSQSRHFRMLTLCDPKGPLL